jgi:hypothetical protein
LPRGHTSTEAEALGLSNLYVEKSSLRIGGRLLRQKLKNRGMYPTIPHYLLRLLLTLPIPSIVASDLSAQDRPQAADLPSGIAFEDPANAALSAMRVRAGQLQVTGVAVVAFAEGDNVTSWSSKMLVVGNMTKPASQNDKGSNLLAIAYSKATEMASTLKDSGSGIRPVLVGEVGWQGGVVARGKTGVLIAAFSGGRSEDDVKISKAGLKILAGAL